MAMTKYRWKDLAKRMKAFVLYRQCFEQCLSVPILFKKLPWNEYAEMRLQVQIIPPQNQDIKLIDCLNHDEPITDTPSELMRSACLMALDKTGD